MQKKINIQNKKAQFEYQILSKYTAGIVLSGTEIKSIRDGKASIKEAFCQFNEKNELFVVGMYIGEYSFAKNYTHVPRSNRKLLRRTLSSQQGRWVLCKSALSER